jgi:hypothetical protein
VSKKTAQEEVIANTLKGAKGLCAGAGRGGWGGGEVHVSVHSLQTCCRLTKGAECLDRNPLISSHRDDHRTNPGARSREGKELHQPCVGRKGVSRHKGTRAHDIAAIDAEHARRRSLITRESVSVRSHVARGHAHAYARAQRFGHRRWFARDVCE